MNEQGHTQHTPKFATIWAIVTLLFALGIAVDLLPNVDSVLRAPATSEQDIDLMGKIISDSSRLLGVSLSMLLALCALAIPLTANVYTPKLIEIFVADRWNRIVLSYFVLANGVVVWNKFVVAGASPVDARWRGLLCVCLALVGVLCIAPYFLYVMRFLVPRGIVLRLQSEIVANIDSAGKAATHADQQAAVEEAVTNIQYLGKITLRSIERYDRDTAAEGLAAMRAVFDHFLARKEFLPAGFLSGKCREILGLGPELALEVERLQATLEVSILQELSLILPIALDKLPEVVAQIAQLLRHLGKRTAERGDHGAREMVVLHFNTFLRQTLKARNADAFYKFVYQYRRLAEELLDTDSRLSRRIAFFLDYYGHQAVRMGMPYLINVVAYDLAALCDLAYRKKSRGRKELLDTLMQLDRDAAGLLDMPGVVKAQAILAAKLKTRGEDGPWMLLVDELRKVSDDKLREAFAQIIRAREENFWEIADRRRHLDHIEATFRPAISELRKELLGEAQPGIDTLLFLKDVERNEVAEPKS